MTDDIFDWSQVNTSIEDTFIGTEQKTPPLVGGDECDLGKIFQ